MAFLWSQFRPGFAIPWQGADWRVVKRLRGGGLLLQDAQTGKRKRLTPLSKDYQAFTRDLFGLWLAQQTCCTLRRIFAHYDGPDCWFCRVGIVAPVTAPDVAALAFVPDRDTAGRAYDPARKRLLSDSEVASMEAAWAID